MNDVRFAYKYEPLGYKLNSKKIKIDTDDFYETIEKTIEYSSYINLPSIIKTENN